MFDILVLGKKLSCKNNKRFQILHAEDFQHKENLDQYIANNCFDIIVVDLHHPAKASTLKKYGHKGLIISFSDDPHSNELLKNAMTSGFDMYFPFQKLEKQLEYIVEAYSNIPKFGEDFLEAGFDMEIYNHIIKHAGFFIYEQFAKSFFDTHPLAQRAYVSQERIVIDYDNSTESSPNDLYFLMRQNNSYVFLFTRKQTVPQLTE